MRISLTVEDGGPAQHTVEVSPQMTTAGGQAGDIDAGPAAAGAEGGVELMESPMSTAAVADAGHRSVSSPGAVSGGQVDADAQEDPSTGEGPVHDEPDGAIEKVANYERADAGTFAEAFVDVDDKLPDVAAASFGAAPEGLEVVLGEDDRVEITATSAYPWRAHCSLRITAADGSQWIGTGWFCGPRTVITAGHCVYIKNSGVPGRDGWARSVTVMPGRRGADLPYGSVASSDLRTVTGWANDGDPEYDYGAILLPADLGTGWLGFGIYSDATLRASTGNISGYPGDKPAGTQWYHARRITSVSERKVFYDIDTVGGQSGSAVYRVVDNNRFAVAIHAYGGVSANSGTRITRQVYDNLLAWRA